MYFSRINATEKIKENETIKSLSAKIRELETSIENNEPVKIELLQILEDLIKELVKQKDIIQNTGKSENGRIYGAVQKGEWLIYM